MNNPEMIVFGVLTPQKYIAYDIYNRRVTELLEANNKMVEENRKLRRDSATIPVTDLHTFGSPDHPDRFIKRSDGTVIDTMDDEVKSKNTTNSLGPCGPTNHDREKLKKWNGGVR